MTTTTADALCAALDDMGTDYDRRDSYSGRSAFGETTVGLVVHPWGRLLRAVSVATERLMDTGSGADIKAFRSEVGRLRMDAMAGEFIVY